MKDFIYYYYGFYPDKIVDKIIFYLIYYKEEIFYLYKIEDINDLMMKYSLSSKYYGFYPFIMNKYGIIISNYNSNYFTLIKKNSFIFNNLIDIRYNFGLIKIEWRRLWIEKSNYYNTLRGINYLIDESIDYYLGLLEIAILYLNEFDKYYYNSYIVHSTFNTSEYFNPMYLKLDIIERDVGEYLKYLFFNDIIDKNKIANFIKDNSNNYNYQLVLIRVIYPNFYFNVIDEIVYNNNDINKLKDIIDKKDKFREYVLFLESEMSKYCDIKKVLL